MKFLFRGVKICDQHIESQKIIDRAYRADNQHEIADELYVPVLWFANERTIYIVGRNRYLGKIIEKVVEQDLRRQHRQKRQKNSGPRHAEHVSEIGTRTHKEILHYVAKRFSPFENSVMQHG